MTKARYRREKKKVSIQVRVYDGGVKAQQLGDLRAPILNHKQEADRTNWKCHKALKLPTPTPRGDFLQPGYTLQILLTALPNTIACGGPFEPPQRVIPN